MANDQDSQVSEGNSDRDAVAEDLLDKLDDDFELGGMRERRMEELRRELLKNQQMQENDHGKYLEIKDEKEVIKITAKAKMAVVHFFHTDFQKCKLMDRHLEKLASRYFSTRFLRVDVANVPWLVTKLEIKVLPCVIAFLDGVTKDRIVGFEGISGGSSKEVNPWALELRLKQAGVLSEDPGALGVNGQRKITSTASRDLDEDDDWDD